MAKSCVIEFFGLPGAGKTTIATRLISQLRENGYEVRDRYQFHDWYRSLSISRRFWILFRAVLVLVGSVRSWLPFVRGGSFNSAIRILRLAARSGAFNDYMHQDKSDFYILDQWAAQEVWSIGANTASRGVIQKQCAFSDLIQLAGLAEWFVHTRLNIDESANRVAQRQHGDSRFDGRSVCAIRSGLAGLDLLDVEIASLCKGLASHFCELDGCRTPEENCGMVMAVLRQIEVGQK